MIMACINSLKTKLMKVKNVVLCSNGAVISFDESGAQIPELQKSWLELWLEFIESKGINPTEIETIETIVNGRTVYVRPFKISDGSWNYQFNEY